MTEFSIREAAPKDAQAIASVQVRTWQHAYRGQLPDALLDSLSVEQRAEWRTQHLSNLPAKAHSLVAVEGATILGFCDVGASHDEGAAEQDGTLFAIYVTPDAMGKGIGSALMEEGVQLLRAEGFTRATLWVLATNTPSRQFYEKRGWATDGTRKTEPWNEFSLDVVRYARDLEQP